MMAAPVAFYRGGPKGWKRKSFPPARCRILKVTMIDFRSEGDLNLSPHRQQWLEGHIDGECRARLGEDRQYFFRQSPSTPCLNLLRACDAVYLEGPQGRRYTGFHGNNSPQGRLRTP